MFGSGIQYYNVGFSMQGVVSRFRFEGSTRGRNTSNEKGLPQRLRLCLLIGQVDLHVRFGDVGDDI